MPSDRYVVNYEAVDGLFYFFREPFKYNKMDRLTAIKLKKFGYSNLLPVFTQTEDELRARGISEELLNKVSLEAAKAWAIGHEYWEPAWERSPGSEPEKHFRFGFTLDDELQAILKCTHGGEELPKEFWIVIRNREKEKERSIQQIAAEKQARETLEEEARRKAEEVAKKPAAAPYVPPPPLRVSLRDALELKFFLFAASSIDTLQISDNLYEALAEHDLRNLSDILQLRDEELQKKANIGYRWVDDLQEALFQAYGNKVPEQFDGHWEGYVQVFPIGLVFEEDLLQALAAYRDRKITYRELKEQVGLE